MGWVVNPTPQPLYPWERDTVPIAHEARWFQGRSEGGAENLVPNGIWSPYRPARGQSLYGRSPGPRIHLKSLKKQKFNFCMDFLNNVTQYLLEVYNENETIKKY
jgi:hypothetical protein